MTVSIHRHSHYRRFGSAVCSRLRWLPAFAVSLFAGHVLQASISLCCARAGLTLCDQVPALVTFAAAAAAASDWWRQATTAKRMELFFLGFMQKRYAGCTTSFPPEYLLAFVFGCARSGESHAAVTLASSLLSFRCGYSTSAFLISWNLLEKKQQQTARYLFFKRSTYNFARPPRCGVDPFSATCSVQASTKDSRRLTQERQGVAGPNLLGFGVHCYVLVWTVKMTTSLAAFNSIRSAMNHPLDKTQLFSGW